MKFKDKVECIITILAYGHKIIDKKFEKYNLIWDSLDTTNLWDRLNNKTYTKHDLIKTNTLWKNIYSTLSWNDIDKISKYHIEEKDNIYVAYTKLKREKNNE